MVNLNDISKYWFEDEESYESFLYVCKAALKLQELAKSGTVELMDSYNEYYDINKVRIVINGCDSEVVFGNVVVAGFEHDDVGRIYMEDMGETKKMLSSWKVFKRIDIDWLKEG